MQKNIEIDTKEVYAVVKKSVDLMIAGDTTALTKILDKDYTLTHITGYVQSKAAWLNEIAQGSMKYHAAQEVAHTIKVNGHTATVTIRHMLDASIWGSRNTWRLQQKMELEKRNGNWIMLQSVASTF